MFWLNKDLEYAERGDPPVLSELGKQVETAISDLPHFYSILDVDKYAIMPDHIHLIMVLHPTDEYQEKSYVSIPTIINQFKQHIVKRAGINVWQKGYYDHVIRSDEDYSRIWNYIDNNPYRLDKLSDNGVLEHL